MQKKLLLKNKLKLKIKYSLKLIKNELLFISMLSFLDVIKYLNLIRCISQPDASIQAFFFWFIINPDCDFSAIVFSDCQEFVVRVILKVKHISSWECEVAFLLSPIFYQEALRCQHVLIFHVLTCFLFITLSWNLL